MVIIGNIHGILNNDRRPEYKFGRLQRYFVRNSAYGKWARELFTMSFMDTERYLRENSDPLLSTDDNDREHPVVNYEGAAATWEVAQPVRFIVDEATDPTNKW